jgi:hypothetical protein
MYKINLLKKEFLKLKTEIISLIDRVDTTKKSHLQNYFYFVSYPLFSLAESVIILCENGKPHSAKILLRSLIESHINIIYHQVDDSEHRLALLAKEGFDTKIKNVRELKDFIRRYPNLESKDSTKLFNNEWLLKAEKWAEVERQAIMKGNNLNENDKESDLKSKAVKCDQASIDGIEKGHFERMYHIIFRQLSPTTHLNVEGIQTFLSKNDKGEYLFSDGDDGDFLLVQAIDICVAFTKDLYECNVLDGETIDTVRNIEKLLKLK